jgi:hypothetical protein
VQRVYGVYIYPQGARPNENERAAALDKLRNLCAVAGITLPDGFTGRLIEGWDCERKRVIWRLDSPLN